MRSSFAKSLGRGVVLSVIVMLLAGTKFPAFAAPGDLTRVSVDLSGAQANGISFGGSISDDGRFVGFRSDANNLVTGDANGAEDAFVHDRQTGITSLVSITTAGEQANYSSSPPGISGDGRFLIFDSQASNLIPDDSNHYAWDVFVHDRQTGETTCVSVNSSEEQGNAGSFNGSISSDGHFVTFETTATNLVSDDTNGKSDVFLRDRQTGETIRISVSSSGAQANDSSYMAGLSADGRYISFESNATNLVSGDTNGAMDVFVHDRQTGETTRVSVASNGMQADDGSFVPGISGNGRYVVFESGATNLVSGDKFGLTHIYVHDRQTGETTRVSVNSDGSQMIGRSSDSSMSDDGRFVAFDYANTDNYGSALFEIYVHDRQTGATILASANMSGGHGLSDQDSSYAAGLSADGRFLAFTSMASNMISGDTNGATDIFVREMAFPSDFLSPNVNSIQPQCGGSGCSYPTGQSVSFVVTFSEIVTGVSMDDFALSMAGDISGASLTDLGGSGNQYVVTVNTAVGDGTLRLDVLDDDSIKDISLNPLGGAGAGNGNFTTGEVYIIDKNNPAVVSSMRVDPNPATGAYVNFAVTFSEDVSGVDALDFILVSSGNVSGGGINEVTGSGKNYNVNVGTGSGEGTLGLNVIDDDSIRDATDHPIGGDGADNGTFTSGEAYTIDRIPACSRTLRVGPNPTTADTIDFTVTFSEAVSGVDQGDFTLTTTGGLSGVFITGISSAVPGTTFNVAVNTGSGDGTIRLDVIDNDSIIGTEGLPLGGTGSGNGNYTSGIPYTVNKTQARLFSETFRSNGTNDGWILESNENSNQGGFKNSTAPTFFIGDDAQNRQYRAILHFPTYYLPDNAVVTQAILIIKSQGLVGTNPFTTHQNINIDIRSGYFGSAGLFGINSMDLTDFQAPAEMNSAGTIQNNPVSGWYWALLDSTANQFINLQGVTQLRLMFQLDDNDNLGADYLAFFSGNYDALSDRPQLLIEYHIQR